MTPPDVSPAQVPYQYVALRCVPRVDREEFVNVGVVLYCQATEFLRAAWHVDPVRLAALSPATAVDQICDALLFVERVCLGDPQAGGASRHPIGQRFGFLKAPRSTVVQPGPVHGGVTTDPENELAHLLATLVHQPADSAGYTGTSSTAPTA